MDRVQELKDIEKLNTLINDIRDTMRDYIKFSIKILNSNTHLGQPLPALHANEFVEFSLVLTKQQRHINTFQSACLENPEIIEMSGAQRGNWFLKRSKEIKTMDDIAALNKKDVSCNNDEQ